MGERQVRNMSLGQNIAAKRKALKLSQETVAQQLGVSRQAVSKWETGQTEPTAKNLVELAGLFGITVSELVEPEKLTEQAEETRNSILKRNLEIVAVGAYTGFAIMSTIRTSDPNFYIYASICILAAGCWMAFNISRLSREVRLSVALKELAYCAVIYCIATFVPPRIGNVFTSVIILIVCVLYAKYIRFRE